MIAAAIAIVAAASFFRTLRTRGSDPTIPGSDPTVWATALLAASPLFWMSGLRPMSDMPGLAATLVALAFSANGLADRRWLPGAALVAGLAAGIRSQTVWLTLPMLVLAMVAQRRAGAWWLLTRPVAALVAAGLAWAVPLIAASGGLAAYLRALGTQAELDFAGVDMVWLNPTPRRLALSLYETFVMPWASVPLGGGRARRGDGWRGRGGAGAIGARSLVLLVAFGPYTLFHLLLQETLTVRYALPILPLVCWLAARSVIAAGRAAPLMAVPLVGAALLVAVPGGLDYGREAHPAFRAIGDALRRAAAEPPAATYAHYSLWRPLQVVDASALRVLPPRHHFEWLGLVEYWRRGGREPVWLLADPRRTDLALIDPQARLDVVRYDWLVANRPELSGMRPTGVDWYRVRMPGWFAGEGWSLTPETGGQARVTAKGPDHQPIQAWIRRRASPMHVMIGTHHLGAPADPAAAIEVAIDGRVLDQWTLSAKERNSLRFLRSSCDVTARG